MTTLYLYVLCLSGVCMEWAFPFPIQDTDVAAILNPLQTADKSNIIRNNLHEASRLNRLLHAYINILQAGPKLSKTDEILNAGDRKDNVLYDDYNSLSKSLFDSAGKPGSSDRIILSSTKDKSSGLDSDRLKREQGWHIQYGKRNGVSLSADGTRQKSIDFTNLVETRDSEEPNFIISDLPKPKLETSLSASPTYALLPKQDVQFALKDAVESVIKASGDATDSKFPKESLEDWESEQGIRNSKRQQGWYIQYGKRSDSKLPLFVL